ncbi:MAG TPA: hypothetical protein VL945_01040 [Candidatus Saccharimonadales bacterium]|nr:hypothetical protein [Candidatus Saccharimonadales bacterium]
METRQRSARAPPQQAVPQSYDRKTKFFKRLGAAIGSTATVAALAGYLLSPFSQASNLSAKDMADKYGWNPWSTKQIELAYNAENSKIPYTANAAKDLQAQEKQYDKAGRLFVELANAAHDSRMETAKAAEGRLSFEAQYNIKAAAKAGLQGGRAMMDEAGDQDPVKFNAAIDYLIKVEYNFKSAYQELKYNPYQNKSDQSSPSVEQDLKALAFGDAAEQTAMSLEKAKNLEASESGGAKAASVDSAYKIATGYFEGFQKLYKAFAGISTDGSAYKVSYAQMDSWQGIPGAVLQAKFINSYKQVVSITLHLERGDYAGAIAIYGELAVQAQQEALHAPRPPSWL